jgi:hypothetical protein
VIIATERSRLLHARQVPRKSLKVARQRQPGRRRLGFAVGQLTLCQPPSYFPAKMVTCLALASSFSTCFG